MNRKYMALAFAFSMMTSITAHSLPTGSDEYVCDGCSDTQEKNMLYSKYGIGFNTAYVFDMDDEEVTKWRVTILNENGDWIYDSFKLTVEASVSDGFSKYRSMVEDLNVDHQADPVIVPTSLFSSAYHVVGNPDAYQDLVEHAYADMNWWDHSWDWAGGAFMSFIGFDVIEYFQFSDGSILEANLIDFSVSNMEFRIDYNYATDADGNVITEDVGSYDPILPVPGSVPVTTYFLNNGFIALDSAGNTWVPEHQKCYAIACATVTMVCNVQEISCN